MMFLSKVDISILFRLVVSCHVPRCAKTCTGTHKAELGVLYVT